VQDGALRVEVNGRRATSDEMALLDHEGWGHFTAMQVRGGRTRGLALHLARLDAAHREIYGQPLDPDLVTARIRRALGDETDASVRVYGFWAGVIVTARGPKDMPGRPHSMTVQHFQRPLARLKHVGSWAQGRFHELAVAAGFDDALLVDETGRISEGSITNVGFWRDDAVIWPAAPKLEGITMLIIRRELAARGIQQADAIVRVGDLDAYGGMILCNARGWARVSRVDSARVRHDDAFTDAIGAAFDACPRDQI
jgi:branched-subunit amino acid aminotransferase/4-amino-4-deoxychorismate lyase